MVALRAGIWRLGGVRPRQATERGCRPFCCDTRRAPPVIVSAGAPTPLAGRRITVPQSGPYLQLPLTVLGHRTAGCSAPRRLPARWIPVCAESTGGGACWSAR